MNSIKALRTLKNNNHHYIPQVLQKNMEFLSLLSQLEHGGFSAFTNSIICFIKLSGGGSVALSFSTVVTLEILLFQLQYRKRPNVKQQKHKCIQI